MYSFFFLISLPPFQFLFWSHYYSPFWLKYCCFNKNIIRNAFRCWYAFNYICVFGKDDKFFNLVYISELHNIYPDFPMYAIAYLTSTARLFKGRATCLKLHLASSLPILAFLSMFLFQWMLWPFCFRLLSTINPMSPK